jgi:hypothetical protein
MPYWQALAEATQIARRKKIERWQFKMLVWSGCQGRYANVEKAPPPPEFDES